MKKSEQKQAALELLADQAKAYNQDHDDAYCEGRFRGILHPIETLGYDTYYEIENGQILAVGVDKLVKRF